MMAMMVPQMTLPAGRRYRDVLLATIALVQCYATRTQDGCAPLSYHATMTECRVLAEDYRRFDSKALAHAGISRRWSATAVLRPSTAQGSWPAGGGQGWFR